MEGARIESCAVLAARVPGEDESAGKATPWLRRRESSLVDTCCTRSGMPGRGEAGDLREEAERPQHYAFDR